MQIIRARQVAASDETRSTLRQLPWDGAFGEYCAKNREKVLQCNQFLSLFGPQLLTQQIQEANARGIICFCNGLEEVYRCPNLADSFAADTPVVQSLVTQISAFLEGTDGHECDRLKRALIRLLAMLHKYAAQLGNN